MVIEIAKVFWLCGKTISLSCSVCMGLVTLGRQKYIPPSAFKVEMAIQKLKIHKTPGIDQIPAERIKAGGRTIQSEVYKLMYSIGN